ncbi:unnamed protein product [Gadus morhua 'NCC']
MSLFVKVQSLEQASSTPCDPLEVQSLEQASSTPCDPLEVQSLEQASSTPCDPLEVQSLEQASSTPCDPLEVQSQEQASSTEGQAYISDLIRAQAERALSLSPVQNFEELQTAERHQGTCL